jgi:hypothetical protein
MEKSANGWVPRCFRWNRTATAPSLSSSQPRRGSDYPSLRAPGTGARVSPFSNAPCVILPIPEMLFILSKTHPADNPCDPRPKQEKKRVTNGNFSLKKWIVT